MLIWGAWKWPFWCKSSQFLHKMICRAILCLSNFCLLPAFLRFFIIRVKRRHDAEFFDGKVRQQMKCTGKYVCEKCRKVREPYHITFWGKLRPIWGWLVEFHISRLLYTSTKTLTFHRLTSLSSHCKMSARIRPAHHFTDSSIKG